jgi:hypothetical protein
LAETFPYHVLIIAIGVSITLVSYIHVEFQKARTTRLIGRIDGAIKEYYHDLDPVKAEQRRKAVGFAAARAYTSGAVGRDSYLMISEHLGRMRELVRVLDLGKSDREPESARAVPIAVVGFPAFGAT